MNTQYEDLLRKVTTAGTHKDDRTGTGTTSLFGEQMRFNLSEGFPLITTKRVYFKGVVHELLWFLNGESNIKYLVDNDVHIWDEWADENGELGPVYGVQWTQWPDPYNPGETINQIEDAVKQIRENPNSRRIIVNAWNPAAVPMQALPPCHSFFQFYVADGKLSLQMYQRSADMFLGVPFNIASYALLTHMVAHVTGLEVGDYVHVLGDTHIYDNHKEQVALQLSREPRPFPTLKLNPDIKNLADFRYEDIMLEGYNPHPGIKGDVAV